MGTITTTKGKPVFEVWVDGKLDLKTASRKHAFDTAGYKLAAGSEVTIHRSQQIYWASPPAELVEV